MIRVQILSPFRGATPADIERNVEYARAALADCFARGEAPFAPHLLYPQVMSDAIEAQRDRSIEASTTWLMSAQLVAVYHDLGVSSGMRTELVVAHCYGVPVDFRNLPDFMEARR